jgi:GNAT superfamily N-acetyltransferase
MGCTPTYIMKKYFYLFIRKLLEMLRRKREYFRPFGFFVLTHLNAEGVVISRITEDDLESLETHLTAGDFTKHRARIKAQREGRADYLVAKQRVPLGHVLIIWEGGDDGPLETRTTKEPLIEDLYVHPAARKKGIGKMLMDEAEALIRTKGFNKVGLAVMVNNPAVETMYKKRGYENTNLGVFECRRTFTGRDGREKQWSANMKYLIKNL